MANTKIKINRAPVLTLWAAVVAERLGYHKSEALTFGKAVAGLNAQSKGKRLGIFEEKHDQQKEPEKATAGQAKPEFVELLGRGVPAVRTPGGLRATIKGEQIQPESVETYLKNKFGEDLDRARAGMEELAAAYPPRELAGRAYELYEKFRPEIPAGKKGWGAQGELDLEYLRSLAK